MRYQKDVVFVLFAVCHECIMACDKSCRWSNVVNAETRKCIFNLSGEGKKTTETKRETESLPSLMNVSVRLGSVLL